MSGFQETREVTQPEDSIHQGILQPHTRRSTVDYCSTRLAKEREPMKILQETLESM